MNSWMLHVGTALQLKSSIGHGRETRMASSKGCNWVCLTWLWRKVHSDTTRYNNSMLRGIVCNIMQPKLTKVQATNAFSLCCYCCLRHLPDDLSRPAICNEYSSSWCEEDLAGMCQPNITLCTGGQKIVLLTYTTHHVWGLLALSDAIACAGATISVRSMLEQVLVIQQLSNDQYYDIHD